MSNYNISILERNVQECEKQLRAAWKKNSDLTNIVHIAKSVIESFDELERAKSIDNVLLIDTLAKKHCAKVKQLELLISIN